MTLPSSGTLTLAEIKTEFGGPNDLKAYYRGGTYVPNSSGNVGIPTSGTINIRSFLGASAFTGAVHTYTSSGTETVPAGAKTVAIEIWGAGGGGNFLSNGGGGYSKSSYACAGGQTLIYSIAGTNGATTCVSGTLAITSMVANLGGGVSTAVGGTASGGNVSNLSGGNTSNGTEIGGNGGAGANGGAGGVAPSGNGTSPGGGGAGTGSAGGLGGGPQIRFTYT